MNPNSDLDAFAKDYFNTDEKDKAHQAAFEYLGSELLSTNKEKTWELILELIKRAKTKADLFYLAAGPLENLLEFQGNVFFERVEKEARTNPFFALTLCGVWFSNKKSETYEKFVKLQKKYKGISIDLPEK